LSKSGDDSASECVTSEAGGWEDTSTLKDVIVNHLPPSEARSLPNNSSATSDFAFDVQSSTDFPSLTDHCLTDSVTAEISMMSSPPRHSVESADDTDVHSVLSTPPLQPDSDNDMTLPPETDHCAKNIFSGHRTDNMFLPKSPTPEQLQLNSMFDDCTTKVVNNCSASDSDVISEQLDMDVNSLLHLGDGDAPKTEEDKGGTRSGGSDEVDRQFNCDLTALADAILDSLNQDKLKSETTLDSRNSDDAALPRDLLQECSRGPSSESINDALDSVLHIALEAALASELESELPTRDDTTVNNANSLCDAGNVTTKTECTSPSRSCDVSSKTVADSHTAAPVSTPESTLNLLVTDVRGNVASDVTMDVEWPALSGSISDECKLFGSTSESMSTTTIDNLISSQSAWNHSDGDRTLLVGSFQSMVKGPPVMPCVASFSSSSSDCDDIWIPDWKLQTNAVVKVKRMDHATLSKYTVGKDNRGVKLQSSSASELSSAQPFTSKMTTDEEPKKSSATDLPTRAAPDMSERSASPVVEQEEDKNRLPSAALVTNVTPSPLGAEQFSSAVASTPVQQKHLDYADCCNSPKFQPVVRLIRLPLEFFCMLQQSPRPSASSSSSISIADFSKRFVTLNI